MKNKILKRPVGLPVSATAILAVALAFTLVFGMTACDNGGGGGGKTGSGETVLPSGTAGKVTLTGFPSETNGKWAVGMTNYSNKPFLVAAMDGSYNNATGQLILKGQKIVDGKIENLKVWEVTFDSSGNVASAVGYNGNAKSVIFYGYALTSDTGTYNYQTGKHSDNEYAYGSATIDFTNGSGTGVVNYY